MIRTPSSEPLHQRLLTIQTELEDWLHHHDPDAIADPWRCSTPQNSRMRSTQVGAGSPLLRRMPGGTGRSTWPGRQSSSKRPSCSRMAVHDCPMT